MLELVHPVHTSMKSCFFLYTNLKGFCFDIYTKIRTKEKMGSREGKALTQRCAAGAVMCKPD